MSSILSEVGKQFSLLKRRISNLGLSDLSDVLPDPQNLGVLQYNSLTKRWSASPPELIGAVIDGGLASTSHVGVFDIDGGGA
jgi:hypothetical protein